MISIVCVYNDKNVLGKWLLAGLKNQSVPYQLILLDNTANQYPSSASALNFGGSQATGKYIMFIHQDVQLTSVDWLINVEQYLDGLKVLGAAGVAGCSKENHGLANVIHGVPPMQAGLKTTRSEEVQTLDGCLFITPTEVFLQTNFDEKVCVSWYLYATDYCLDLGRKNYKIYVIPHEIYHLSKGEHARQTKGFQDTVTKILEKHREEVDCIYTTTGIWPTN